MRDPSHPVDMNTQSTGTAIVRGLDVTQGDAPAVLEEVRDEIGGADLVIISAGAGHNGAMHWEQDVETVAVNVLAFMAVAQVRPHSCAARLCRTPRARSAHETASRAAQKLWPAGILGRSTQ
jgi:hypothetical protein